MSSTELFMFLFICMAASLSFLLVIVLGKETELILIGFDVTVESHCVTSCLGYNEVPFETKTVFALQTKLYTTLLSDSFCFIPLYVAIGRLKILSCFSI